MGLIVQDAHGLRIEAEPNAISVSVRGDWLEFAVPLGFAPIQPYRYLSLNDRTRMSRCESDAMGSLRLVLSFPDEHATPDAIAWVVAELGAAVEEIQRLIQLKPDSPFGPWGDQ